jgi:hypothetical protein
MEGSEDPLTTLPTATGRRIQDRLTDFLRLIGILEGGGAVFACFQGFQEVSHLMYERVFVSDAESGDPPFVHVRLFAIRDMDRSPSPQIRFIAIIEVFQSVKVMQIPADGCVCPVDLEGVQRLMSTGIAGGFEETK